MAYEPRPGYNSLGQREFTLQPSPLRNVNAVNANVPGGYRDYTSPSTACTGAITVAVSWFVIRVGHTVTIEFPYITDTLNTTALAYFRFGAVLPEAFRPRGTFYFPVTIIDNGVFQAQAGVLLVSAVGIMDVYKLTNGSANFTAATEAGIPATSVSWVAF